jgi:uncharacterized membrane protein YoaK (UPF0700 family)
MSDQFRYSPTETILLLTAFAAGSVDVVSFAVLGGVFASAMTGNFALLAWYVARSDFQSAMGSVVALSGFVVGCAVGILQRRGRPAGNAITLLLMSECGLLLFFALYALWAPGLSSGPGGHLQIALLSVAMGLQAVLGQTISVTSIVFTTTLTRLVASVADSLSHGEPTALRELKIQSSVVMAYLFGALLAGALVVHQVSLVMTLPFLGAAAALGVHRWATPQPR